MPEPSPTEKPLADSPFAESVSPPFKHLATVTERLLKNRGAQTLVRSEAHFADGQMFPGIGLLAENCMN